MSVDVYRPVEEAEALGPTTECGILAMYRPQAPISVDQLLIPALHSGGKELQHRGEQSTGLAIHKTTGIIDVRGIGTIDHVLTPQQLEFHHGEAYGGGVHVRWTTNGATSEENVHPIPVDIGNYRIAHLMVNGNTPAAHALLPYIPYALDSHASDTVIMAHAMANAPGNSLEEKFGWLCAQPAVRNSAFCAVAMSGDTMVVGRDRFGLHPLVLGEIEDSEGPIHVIASEEVAINKIGGRAIRSVNPGEILKIDRNGIATIDDGSEIAIPAECIFEYIYFMAANSFDVRSGVPPELLRTIGNVRYSIGTGMAEHLQQELAEIDFLSDSPNSGKWFTSGVLKGPQRVDYIPIIQRIMNSRSFTQGADAQTTISRVRQKLDFIRDPAMIRGKHIGIGDDSLIQGNTAKTIVEILKGLGAADVSFFLSMPQVRDDCHLGVNLKGWETMIANICDGDEEKIAKAIGAKYVRFARHDVVIKAIKNTQNIVIPPQYTGDNHDLLYLANGLCPGCVTGHHVVDKRGTLQHYIPLQNT